MGQQFIERMANGTPKKTCCACHCHEVQVPVTLRDTFFQDPIFSRSWDDFDQMRRDMITESRRAWEEFDKELKNVEQKPFSSRSLDIEVDPKPKLATENQTSSAAATEIKESLLPETAAAERRPPLFTPIKLIRFPSRSAEKDESLLDVIKVKDNDKSFEITMDTSQYKPGELMVNVVNHNLTVEAKHTDQSEDGRSFVSRQFLRRYTLPSDCKQDLVTSNLSSDGVLVISSPKMPPQMNTECRSVPIQMN